MPRPRHGVRVLNRLIRRSKPLVGELLAGVRDAFRTWLRTMRQGLQQLHRLVRRKGEEVAEARTAIYRKLVATAEKTVAHAERVRTTLEEAGPAVGQRLREQVAHFVPLVRQVMDRARHRVLEGQKVPAAEKLVSLFELHTQIIPRHKGGADVEFGRTVVADEVEGGLVTRYHLLDDGESEQGEMPLALEHHRAVLGHASTLLTSDRGMHSPDNARIAREAGLQHLVITRAGPVTPAQRAREQARSWRRRYRWQAGIERRISSLQRDYGLRRCLYHGKGHTEEIHKRLSALRMLTSNSFLRELVPWHPFADPRTHFPAHRFRLPLHPTQQLLHSPHNRRYLDRLHRREMLLDGRKVTFDRVCKPQSEAVSWAM
jgi:IS5 family transposase